VDPHAGPPGRPGEAHGQLAGMQEPGSYCRRAVHAGTTVVADMGRSRRRLRSTGAATPTAAARAAPAPAELRRVLAAYLAGALALAIVVLAGTVLLAGALGPWVVLVGVGGGALALRAWIAGRLEGAPLSDEDRLLRTMASGLLVLVVLFAIVAAVVLTVA
jgi:hypothetical protein